MRSASHRNMRVRVRLRVSGSRFQTGVAAALTIFVRLMFWPKTLAGLSLHIAGAGRGIIKMSPFYYFHTLQPFFLTPTFFFF